MTQNSVRARSLFAALQVGAIAGVCVLAWYITRDHHLIPKALMRLPPVYVTSSDMWSLMRLFSGTVLIQVLITTLLWRSHAFASPARFASEYLAFLVAYTTASLLAFLTTTINYDPQLVAGIGLFATFAYLIIYVVMSVIRSAGAFLRDITAMLRHLFGRLLSLPGLLILLYFISPLVLALAFIKDRDVANRVTQIRVWFNPAPATDWGFQNFLPGQVFEQPVLVTQTPGDASTIYVLERVGRVYRVSLDDREKRSLVLDIRDQLGEVESENGALGLAFHPRFNEPSGDYRFFYLYYTDSRPSEGQLNRLSRFALASADPDAVRSTEQPLMELQREGSGFHNGGSLEFGPDGYLYIGFGEGVRTPQASTSATSLRGGILRIDVDEQPDNLPIEPMAAGLLQGYRVPADNPFVDDSRVRNEFWALGLRNPFRFSFDEPSGALWVGDVGSAVWEEVNRIEKGAHYGYPMVEGREPTGRAGWEDLGIPFAEPVYTYVHDAYDRAVIGGIVYLGENYPPLKDQYVFADNYSAKLFAIPADSDRVDDALLLARANQYAQRGVSSVVQLATGEILVTTLGAASEPSGEVLLLVRAEDADVVDTGFATKTSPAGYDDAATASLFTVNCARCHGVKGDGKGPDSELMNVPMPDLTSPVYHFSRSGDAIRAVIAKGGAAQGMSAMMPPWEGFLADEEIDNLVLYIQSLPNKHHRH